MAAISLGTRAKRELTDTIMFSYGSVLPDHLIMKFQSCRATRAATSNSAGIASSSIPASAFLAAKSTMLNRVSIVALAMWGKITHLRTRIRNQWVLFFPRERRSFLRTWAPSRVDGLRRRAVRPRRRPGQLPISNLHAAPARAHLSRRAHRAKCSRAQRASSSCAEIPYRRYAASRRRPAQARRVGRFPARARPVRRAVRIEVRGVPQALPRVRGRTARTGSRRRCSA